eukprot:COSAG05_NODE_2276_length_3296_cov_4097.429152_1_plen_24_part_10
MVSELRIIWKQAVLKILWVLQHAR